MRAIKSSSNAESKTKSTQNRPFDAQAFLDSAGVARKPKEFKKAEVVYSQGDAAKSVMYLQKGGVKLTVVNEVGKEAVVAILGPGDFFGEGCLAGQPVRMGTATAITPSTVLVIEKGEMLKVLHEQHALSDRFISFHAGAKHPNRGGLDRSAVQLQREAARPHSSIACTLRQGRRAPTELLPKVSQETLAEMIGTTRSRVNFFMNKFRKLGFIKYNGGLEINTSLLSVVLHD